jgi:hypothetical protein
MGLKIITSWSLEWHITSVPYFMKIYHVLHKLLVGDTQNDRQTGDLISLLSFLVPLISN